MTSILSSISGYFSKSLILGTFLPVIIFIILNLLLLVPLLPAELADLSAPLKALDKEWQVIVISFFAIVMSGLIYNLNIPILRLYEGYPWKNSWIGSWFTNRHLAKFETAQLRVDSMRAVLRSLKTAEDDLLRTGKALQEAISRHRKNPTDAHWQAVIATDNDLASQTKFVKEVIDNWNALRAPFRDKRFRPRQWLKAWSESHEGSELNEAETVEQLRLIQSQLHTEFSIYRVQLQHTYPNSSGLILPTRLGNVIRSFEYYSDREYGIDSIEIWPRLVSVIPKDYAVSIDDTKTTFDFMMNCSLLTGLLSVLILMVGLIYPAALGSLSMAFYWMGKIILFALLSFFFYRLSINRAGAWGLLIKSAFDLYRWELLKKLGHEKAPKKREDERALWEEISRQMIYGDRYDKKMLDYAELPLSFPEVQSVSPKETLEITRGVKPSPGTDSLTVYLRVRNTDPDQPATAIIVKDKLSDDLDFEWNSARAGGDPVRTSGANPYEFELGDLPGAAERILTYRVIPKKKGQIAVSLT